MRSLKTLLECHRGRLRAIKSHLNDPRGGKARERLGRWVREAVMLHRRNRRRVFDGCPPIDWEDY